MKRGWLHSTVEHEVSEELIWFKFRVGKLFTKNEDAWCAHHVTDQCGTDFARDWLNTFPNENDKDRKMFPFRFVTRILSRPLCSCRKSLYSGVKPSPKFIISRFSVALKWFLHNMKWKKIENRISPTKTTLSSTWMIKWRLDNLF